MSAKELLLKLGLSNEDIQAIETDQTKIDEIATSFTSKFENSTKERYKSLWEKENAENYQKTASIGVYNKIEPEVAKVFGLEYDQYKNIDKDRLKKMLSDAKASFEAKVQEAEKKASEGKDQNVLQLQKQLEELQADYKRLKEIEESMPSKIEQERQAIKKEYTIKDVVNRALTAVQPKLIDVITPDIVATLLEKKAKLDVIFDNDGTPKVQILDPQTGTLAKRSNTENYTDLALFIEEQILKGQNWLKMQKQGGGNDPQPKPNGGDKPKAQPWVHPRFTEYYSK